MAQDTALLRYLLKWARRAPWSWSQRDLAFAFDWTNDYISSNATIGRTGYDMNVSWNVSTGSDGDGSYIQFNGNRAAWAATWTTAWIAVASSPWYTQANSFTLWWKFKVGWYAITTTSWLFWPVSVATISYTTTNTLRFTLRWSTTVNYDVTIWFTLWTAFYAHMVYDSATAKFYCYIDWILKNTWWTAWPATFNMSTIYLWDTAIGTWNADSSNKYIYHAAIRNKALTQAEIDADIALWNTTKNDPSIVAYYIPDNLQYNTQYMLNPKALDQSPRSPTWTSSVVANTTVAPDWTTTADTLTIIWTATQGIEQPNTTITWSSLASKTFIIKAFVKVAAATALFRLKLTHWAVADYFSANQTATTTRQEFTFTKTFTSATTWTWIIWWIVNDTVWLNPILQVRNVRVFLVNETLRDESPNIWWFLWWKQNEVISARIKPTADAVWSTGDTQCFMLSPYYYWHLRTTSNTINLRFDTRLTSVWQASSLWNWFRNKVHILWIRMRDWSKFVSTCYVNGILVSTGNWSALPPTVSTNYWNNAQLWRKWSTYFSWNIRDARIYTFTWSFTDADALAIYNGGEPTSSGVTKYLHYRPPVGEVGTTTQDQSPNDRDWTLNGWVTRDYI